MNERYIVTTASGQPVIRTNDRTEAYRYRHVLKGLVVDREAVTEPELVDA